MGRPYYKPLTPKPGLVFVFVRRQCRRHGGCRRAVPRSKTSFVKAGEGMIGPPPFAECFAVDPGQQSIAKCISWTLIFSDFYPSGIFLQDPSTGSCCFAALHLTALSG